MSLSIGVWIWNVRHCEEGDTARIVAKAKDTGLGHVLIKTNDGRDSYNGTLRPLVSALQAAGVHVWSWQYTYGFHPLEEALAFAQRSLALSVDGLCVDAEVEYLNQPKAAIAYMDALRGNLPQGKAVAVSSYYLPQNHASFPWREFYDRATHAMPQVYWYTNAPATALSRSLAQHVKYRSVPVEQWVIPAGTITPAHHSTPASVAVFVETARRAGLPSVNFWSWEHATPELWEALETSAKET